MNKIFEKIKTRKRLSVSMGFVVFFILIFFTFFYDIGFNSKYFIKKDFSQAFLLRQTGNCEEFVKYLNKDWANWVSRCYEEKEVKNDKVPIKDFAVKKITINGDRSFLQVEIHRDNIIKSSELEYIVNYEMLRIKGRWFIDQQII
jgi:hypothetical protein